MSREKADNSNKDGLGSRAESAAADSGVSKHAGDSTDFQTVGSAASAKSTKGAKSTENTVGAEHTVGAESTESTEPRSLDKANEPHENQATPTDPAVRRTALVAAISGLLAFICFCLTPILPVNQTQSSLNWPQQGSVESITAPLMSYSPQSLDMTVPLTVRDDLNDDQTDILSTLPFDSGNTAARGLSVRRTNAGIDVITRNRIVVEIDEQTLESLPSDAKLIVHSDANSTSANVPGQTGKDGKPLGGTVDGDVRPQLTGVFTEIKSSAGKDAMAAGLAVHVEIDSRYTSSPTAIKYAVMFLGVLLAIVSLGALRRLDKLGRLQPPPLLNQDWWKIKPLDAIVGAILVFWYFIGANTSDDGYLLTMARASQHSGYMANYYRWFGVPESPFGAPYYDLLGLMTHVSTTSTWMRLPGLIAGLLIWMLLSREVIPRLGDKIAQRRVAYWTSAFVFLALWMGYDNGLRPEPVIALGALFTWVCFERAIARGQLFPAAIGVVVASISLAAGPTGLMAVASLLAALSGVIRIAIRRMPLLGAPKGASKKTITIAILAQAAPFLAAGTAILTAVFGDQTLRTVIESIQLRGAVGPSLHWYEETVRYEALFAPGVDGSFPRRFGVFMVMTGLVTVLASMLHNRTIPGTATGPSRRLVIVMIGTMFFMAFTPTKWTHHFGVYAGIGAAVAALAAVAASEFALRSSRNRYLYLGAVLFVFAWSLSGYNGWWYVSSLGVPWYDKTIQVHHIEASMVMLVISLLVMLWGVIQSFRTDIQETLATSEAETKELRDRDRARAQRLTGLAAAPIAVLCMVVVAFNCFALSKGALKQYPAYSVGLGNLRTLAGHSCQMADYVEVEEYPSKNLLKTADGSPIGDSLTAEKNQNFEPNNIPSRIIADERDENSASVSTVGQTAASSGSTSGSSSSNSNKSSSSDRSSDHSASSSDSSDSSGATSSEDTGETHANDSSKLGINGSAAWLPFGLDPTQVPVVGSFTSDLQVPAEATSAWYDLSDHSSPIVVVSAAGRIHHWDQNGVEQPGRTLVLEYGHREADGKTTKTGELSPLDPGPSPMWRNLRFRMSDIPKDANVVRIHAVDDDLSRGQWLAFTPPRVPKLQTLNEYVGSDAPVLMDWVVSLQFPCQRPYDHWAGVAEQAKYRISPDYQSRKANVSWQDYYGGGASGMVESTSTPLELATYFRDDWARDWGELDLLLPLANSERKQIKVGTYEEHTVRRSGLWYPGPMNYEDQNQDAS